MEARILIVEDDEGISRLLCLELQHEGYRVESVADGREALDLMNEKRYDLILLDVMLPSLNGIEVLRRFRQNSDVPVIILTARDSVMDKVAGLDIGANDYMTKPFAIEELLARVRANLRKNRQETGVGNLTIDLSAHTAFYGGEEIELTKKEFDLLAYLVQHKNAVISRERLLDAVWGFDFYGNTNVVDVYVRYLRAKIDDRFGVKLISTVRGSGYIIKDEK